MGQSFIAHQGLSAKNRNALVIATHRGIAGSNFFY